MSPKFHIMFKLLTYLSLCSIDINGCTFEKQLEILNI